MQLQFQGRWDIYTIAIATTVSTASIVVTVSACHGCHYCYSQQVKSPSERLEDHAEENAVSRTAKCETEEVSMEE